MAESAIGVIGLGTAGAPIAERLQDEGHTLQVFDAVTQFSRNFMVHGGTGAVATASMIAQLCDIIIIATDTDAATRNVTFGPTGFISQTRAGTLVVDMASDDPALTIDIARALAPRGVALVDVPVIGTAADAASGRLKLLCSGQEDQLVRCQPVFDALSQHVVRIGDVPGLARAARALARLYGAANLAAAGETLLIGERFGLSSEMTLAAIEALGPTSGAPPWTLRGDVLTRRFDSGYPFDHLLRDMDCALAAAQTHGTPAPLARLVREIAAATQLRWPAAQDHTEIVRGLEANACTELRERREQRPEERPAAPRDSLRS